MFFKNTGLVMRLRVKPVSAVVKIELLKYCSKKGSARACVCVCVHKVGGARRGKV